jgi:hypothetical protein
VGGENKYIGFSGGKGSGASAKKSSSYSASSSSSAVKKSAKIVTHIPAPVQQTLSLSSAVLGEPMWLLDDDAMYRLSLQIEPRNATKEQIQ